MLRRCFAAGPRPAPWIQSNCPEPLVPPLSHGYNPAMKQACLYDRLGGASAIDAAAELFCRKVLADPALASYFGGADINRQIGKQAAFLAMVLDGPNSYTGADLRTAHAGLPRLNDWHFDRVIGHWGPTLRELGAAEPDIAAAGAIAESTRDHVLNR